MKCSAFLLLTAAVLCAAVALAQTTPEPLATWLPKQRWQRRVVLLCAPSSSSSALLVQQQRFASAAAAMQEHDLVVREVLTEQLSAADMHYLTKKLGVKSSGFTLLLIGKDGGVKRRETQAITAESLFQTIDVMPMRRSEARTTKRP
ncbi:DUF4174 domain-containing protein [Hymenobacter taeanensis]|uniref:DUF4174 domain-containing protein n=1 Tax=Hymenobacter taeanensis TaxID=2735321 RepID=A0A6M6BF33_9BACT|nr:MULTISPECIES: DUF4174 domain-containing protein [Hymenobacter]QJX45843.1 DUF4174 domain-containing protein [Hymenobacter taeanensis]UOQ79686.1 DUF4174 domain-containing protein [Hymenobacter sp. 5414T-23]